MPLLVNFTDSNAINYPTSYWLMRWIGTNIADKSGTVIFHGWQDKAAFVANQPIIGEHQYVINDPAIYEQSFGHGQFVENVSFYAVLEQFLATSIDTFFSGLILQYSYLEIVGVEIGSQGASRVIVTFRATVAKAGRASYTTGVTVKVNGVSATISSGSLSSDQLSFYYDLASPVSPSDVVTWEYNSSAQNLIDARPMALQEFGAQAVTNTIGGYWQFDKAANSGQILLAF